MGGVIVRWGCGEWSGGTNNLIMLYFLVVS
jgi:hypothetical protein